jgi:acyl-CoA reductase-like NAD-dependent aldehyde dehydrogenase
MLRPVAKREGACMSSDWTEVRTPLIINGEEIFTKETFPVYDPSATGNVVGHASAASAAEATAAVAAADAAFASWAATTPSERVKLSLSALEGLDADAEYRAELLTRENGKLRFESAIDLQVFVGRFHQAAEFATVLDEPERLAGPPFNSTISHLPYGVTTIIIPFNWPLAILAASLPHALMAGNTVVVKPPPTTPLSVVETLRHVAKVLPPGVLNVITGHDAIVGSPVIEDSRVRKICFTGSTNGGRNIMKMATTNLAAVTLELGGNDPAIILEDATLDDAAFQGLVMGAFLTTGQVCMAMKRLYVPNRRFDEVVDGMRAVLEHTVVGPGLAAESTMGPLNMKRQKEIVTGLVREARASGAEVIELGSYLDGAPGASENYLLPSLVLNPGSDLGIVTEEQFGPSLPIIGYDNEAEAVAQANDTWSGLCSSVWSSDLEHGSAIAAQLRTGVTFYNGHNAPCVDERAPFGGFNQSGIGRELGREGILAFTETHVVAIPAS